MRQYAYLQILLISFVLLSPIAYATNYQETYIGVAVGQSMVDSFYPVIILDEHTPYLPLNQTVFSWLDMTGSCNRAGHCEVTLKRKIVHHFWLDKRMAQCGEKGKTHSITLPSHVLVEYKSHWYLRYDIFQRWLPLSVVWRLTEYAIYITPHYPSEAEMAHQRRLEYQHETQMTAEAAAQAALPVLLPTKALDLQSRYRVNVTNPLTKNMMLSTELDLNADIFRGTLLMTGSALLSDPSGFNVNPIYWNYSLQKPGLFHLLQVGDTYYNGTLLLPVFNLKAGILFERLRPRSRREGFVYQGHTLPGTEIDVYRNSILVKILVADASGSFNVNYVNAIPGDIFVFRYYYKDGSGAQKVIHIAPDDAALIGYHQVDVQFQSGQLNSSGATLIPMTPDNNFTHFGVGLGVGHRITIGLDAYHFPLTMNDAGGGMHVDWQVFPTVNTLIELLAYDSDVDVALRTNIAVFPHQQIQFRAQRFGEDSPVWALKQSTVFDDLSFTGIFPKPKQFWLLKDSIDIGRWQVIPEYINSDVGDFGGITAVGGIGAQVSALLSAGLAHPDYQDFDGFFRASLFFSFNMHHLIELSRDEFRNQSKWLVTYRYQSLSDKGFNINISAVKPDHQSFNLAAEIQWQISHALSISLLGDAHSVNGQVSLLGLLALNPGPDDYNNFATGTVEGIVLAPPMGVGAPPTPVMGAVIRVGSRTVHTDRLGHYKVSGLPPYTRLPLSVVDDSLDASLVPDQPVVMLMFRPGTSIGYDPKLDWTVGMDGTVRHHGLPIPKGTRIEVLLPTASRSEKPLATARVEENGFFILNKLRSGHYILTLHGVPNAPRQAIDIDANKGWVANVQLNWPVKPDKVSVQH